MFSFSSSSNRAGPHSEFSYASPSSTSSPPSLLASRKCRTLGSSLDRWIPPPSDGFINEDSRVGGPVLCSVPVLIIPLPKTTPELVRLHNDNMSLARDVQLILEQFSVRWTDIGIEARISKFDPEPNPVPTVSIIATREHVDDNWLQAARAVHQRLLERGFQNVQVEIADPLALQVPTCFPVLESDEVFHVWEAICRKILDTFNLREWVSLECYRYGKDKDVMKNPPCIIVSVFPHSRTNWTPTRNRIVSILHEHHLWGVGVYIVPDRIVQRMDHQRTAETDDPWVLREPVLPSDASDRPALAGASMGPDMDDSGSGTLGGFVELKFKEGGEWAKFALSCFHCVYPLDPIHDPPVKINDVRKWSSQPVLPADPEAARLLKVNQPAARDIGTHVKYLEKQVDDIRSPTFCRIEADVLAEECVVPRDLAFYKRENNSLERLHGEKERFKDLLTTGKHYLGSVFAGSGLQKFKGNTANADELPSILDWALVEISPERRTESTSICPYGSSFNGRPFARDLGVDRFFSGNPYNCDALFKAGRSTWYTSGNYNGLKQAHIAREIKNGQEIARPTMEHVVTGSLRRSFSEEGDSGALVVTRSGEVVGLLFGGSQGKNVSYFTHVNDVVEDIKAVTGAVAVRMMGDLD